MTAHAVDGGAAGTSAATVSVLVVDDNEVVRSGLVSLLDCASEVEVVGEAASGGEAVSKALDLRPDVVLMDVRMPRGDGVAAAAQIGGGTRVLMLTFSDEPEVVRDALAAGAAGYLVHGQFEAADLVSAVLAVHRGAGVFSGPALDVLRSPVPPALPVRPAAGLSPRQVEVMDLIAEGLSNAAIARRCYLSEKTVKNHVNHLFAKLGATSRAEAIALWLGTAKPAPGDPGADGPGVGLQAHRSGATRA